MSASFESRTESQSRIEHRRASEPISTFDDRYAIPLERDPDVPRMAGTTGLAAALRRHPFVVVLPMLVLLAAGIVIGAKKPLSYGALATINVGKSDINTQATPGYVTASEALAATYSRLVASQHVIVPVARALRRSPTSVAASLTAVPIPNEPTFTITAQASSSGGAITLVRQTITTLQALVRRSATQQGGPEQLIRKYQAAEQKANTLQQASQRLSGRYAGHVPGVSKAAVVNARTASEVALLQAQALSSEYLNLASSGTAPALDVLTSPTVASTTNRTSNVEKYGVIGAIGGLVIGISLAGLVGALGERRLRSAVRA
jgi:hypothetical protein